MKIRSNKPFFSVYYSQIFISSLFSHSQSKERSSISGSLDDLDFSSVQVRPQLFCPLATMSSNSSFRRLAL
jgi:hypothetical protein